MFKAAQPLNALKIHVSLGILLPLKTISVQMAGQQRAPWAPAYTTSAGNGASHLASVQRFGRDATVDGTGAVMAGAAPPLPKMTFDVEPATATTSTWQDSIIWMGAHTNVGPMGNAQYASHFSNVAFSSVGLMGCDPEFEPCPNYYYGSLHGDWDGDGRSDWLHWEIRAQTCTTVRFAVSLARKSGSSTVITSSNAVGSGIGSSGCFDHALTADLNGDGRDDVLLVNGWRNLRAAASRGHGTFELKPLFATGFTWQTHLPKCAVGDLDADGRADLAGSYDIRTYMAGSPNDGKDDGRTEHPSYANEKEYIVGLPAYDNVSADSKGHPAGGGGSARRLCTRMMRTPRMPRRLGALASSDGLRRGMIEPAPT
jgi:hypothetical protein